MVSLRETWVRIPPFGVARGAASWLSLGFGQGFKAERVGFEPTVRAKRTLVFETSSFSRSDTSPKVACLRGGRTARGRGRYYKQIDAAGNRRCDPPLLGQLPMRPQATRRLPLPSTPLTSRPDPVTEPPATPDSEPVRVGDRVTVTQQIQNKGWTTTVTGTVQAVEQRKTGSWFAHAKDDRLWLDRLELIKDDGEVVVCNLDAYSRVEAAPKAIPADEAG